MQYRLVMVGVACFLFGVVIAPPSRQAVSFSEPSRSTPGSSQTTQPPKGVWIPIDQMKIRIRHGIDINRMGNAAIGDETYHDAVRLGWGDGWILFDLGEGVDCFEAMVGLHNEWTVERTRITFEADGEPCLKKSIEVKKREIRIFEADGEPCLKKSIEVKKREIRIGPIIIRMRKAEKAEKAKKVRIPLQGKRTFAIKIEGGGAVFANAGFRKEAPPPTGGEPSWSTSTSSQTTQPPKGVWIPIDQMKIRINKNVGRYFRMKDATIKGVAYDDAVELYCDAYWGEAFIVFDLGEGVDYFEAMVGIHDAWSYNTKCRVTFEADGKPCLEKPLDVEYGERAKEVRIPLQGKRTFTIKISPGRVVFANAGFRVGRVDEKPPATANGNLQPVDVPAPFVVDPNDLDKLAAKMRANAEANPRLKERLEKGNVAIATFALIDIPSRSVAKNVAEDLYTSMIKSGFRLVERGQLDKVLEELKISEAGMIDPKTAQKIGNLAGCDFILLGSISDRGTFVVINARLMETATGKSVIAERVEMRKIPLQR